MNDDLRSIPRDEPNSHEDSDAAEVVRLRRPAQQAAQPNSYEFGYEGLPPQPNAHEFGYRDDDDLEPERYELFAEPRYQFALERRDFLKLAGAGIAVGLVCGRADAYQPPGRGRGGRGFGQPMPQELSAWLHIDEEGVVTVYTGKVEVGQNVRTSLCQAVAEELKLLVWDVRLVMGDTERVPYDMGTFGSMSTPQMAPQLARVAAAARELLLDLAAERLAVDRARLVLAKGKVSDRDGEKSVSFGELTKGQKLTKTISADAEVTPANEWKVLGTSVKKLDSRAIVTGQHKYASDTKLPGTLYGKVLRSPLLDGKLASADLSAAQAMPGIVAVRDGDFVGVAADNEFLAGQALAKIKAEWNYSSQPSGTDLFQELKANRAEGGGGGFGGRGNQNRGSIEEGLAAADHKLEASFTIAYIAHVPMEPRAALAEWKDGKLTVWTGTQCPFRVRGELARAFRIDEHLIQVIVPDTGSAYGGKHTVDTAIEAARLAKAARKPVKIIWTREEEFTWAYFRPAGVIDVKAGVKKDGTITAWEFHNFNSGGSAIQPAYDIPNLQTAFHPSRAPLKSGSYRALAATANHFARESHIDDLAHAAGIEPLEFRMKNLKEPRLRAVLEAAAKQFGWGNGPPPKGRGFGIAGGTEKGSYVATCAEVAVEEGTGKLRVVRLTTAFECGAIRNPDHLKNQVDGAVIMGLGGALFEAIELEDGRIVNASLTKYRVPRFGDVPALETVLINRPDLRSAGAGETPIVAVAPAIGNAIFAASGVRLRSMPMAPGGVVKG